MNRVFVGVLPRETTESVLEEYFGNFGKVEEVLILYDKETGNSKGFGFVAFAESSTAEQVLAAHNHYILGRKVDVNPARPRGLKDRNLSKHQFGDRKIFVGGLPDTLTISEFKAYFENFGPVQDAVIMHDSEGRSRGFGFITFDSSAIAKNVLETRFYELNNKRVEVKIAESRENMIGAYPARTFDYDLYYCRNNPWRSFDPYSHTHPYYPYGQPMFYGVEPCPMYYRLMPQMESQSPYMVNPSESSPLRVGTRSNVKVTIRCPNYLNTNGVGNSVLESTCSVEKGDKSSIDATVVASDRIEVENVSDETCST